MGDLFHCPYFSNAVASSDPVPQTHTLSSLSPRVEVVSVSTCTRRDTFPVEDIFPEIQDYFGSASVPNSENSRSKSNVFVAGDSNIPKGKKQNAKHRKGRGEKPPPKKVSSKDKTRKTAEKTTTAALEGLANLVSGNNKTGEGELDGLSRLFNSMGIEGLDSNTVSKVQEYIKTATAHQGGTNVLSSLLQSMKSGDVSGKTKTKDNVKKREREKRTPTTSRISPMTSQPNASESQEIHDSLPYEMLRPPVVKLADIRSKFSFHGSDSSNENENANEADTCHALVLSGGGARGAFQGGAIVGLSEAYKAHEKHLKWDVVSGISVGSLQAVGSLAFSPGQNDELDFGRSLWNIWSELRSDDIMECDEDYNSSDPSRIIQWFSSFNTVLENEDGIVNAPCTIEPLEETLKQFLSRFQIEIPQNYNSSSNDSNSSATTAGFVRTAVVSAALVYSQRNFLNKLVSWKFRNWSIKTNVTLRKDIIQKLEAATSVPTVFSPKKILNTETQKYEWFMDGAMVRLLNIDEAIATCLEILHERKSHKQKKDGEEGVDDSQTEAKESKNDRKIKGLPYSGESISFDDLPKRFPELARSLNSGSRIVLDVIGAIPLEMQTVDSSIKNVYNKVESSLSGSPSQFTLLQNKPPLQLMLDALKEYQPLVSIRHALFPDDDNDDDVQLKSMLDLSKSDQLLNMGRREGWTARSLEELRDNL